MSFAPLSIVFCLVNLVLSTPLHLLEAAGQQLPPQYSPHRRTPLITTECQFCNDFRREPCADNANTCGPCRLGCVNSALRWCNDPSCSSARKLACTAMNRQPCSPCSTQCGECLEGFEEGPGEECVNINDCAGNDACANGGTCVDGVLGFTCACAEGFSGASCEQSQMATANDEICNAKRCSNGGTCVDVAGGFQCQCAPGWTGTTCLMDIDECAGMVCSNGGTCVNTAGSFSCTCQPGFSGTTCGDVVSTATQAPPAESISSTKAPSAITTTSVATKDCNGASCTGGTVCLQPQDGTGTPLCACPVGWAGQDCRECAPDFFPINGSCVLVISQATKTETTTTAETSCPGFLNLCWYWWAIMAGAVFCCGWCFCATLALRNRRSNRKNSQDFRKPSGMDLPEARHRRYSFAKGHPTKTLVGTLPEQSFIINPKAQGYVQENPYGPAPDAESFTKFGDHQNKKATVQEIQEDVAADANSRASSPGDKSGQDRKHMPKLGQSQETPQKDLQMRIPAGTRVSKKEAGAGPHLSPTPASGQPGHSPGDLSNSGWQTVYDGSKYQSPANKTEDNENKVNWRASPPPPPPPPPSMEEEQKHTPETNQVRWKKSTSPPALPMSPVPGPTIKRQETTLLSTEKKSALVNLGKRQEMNQESRDQQMKPNRLDEDLAAASFESAPPSRQPSSMSSIPPPPPRDFSEMDNIRE